MKNYLLLIPIVLFFGCESENISSELNNTESSIIITGINQGISYNFQSNSGRVASNVPQDINMLQILVVDEEQNIIYEQYYYNANAYNDQYYDSTAHEGDDYLFENTIPDSLYIPTLPDGEYAVLASTAYTTYSYNYSDSNGYSYSKPIIESYTISDAPIFVGQTTATVSQERDELVVINMENISARVDMNLTSSTYDWYFDLQIIANDLKRYDFESGALESNEYDYHDYSSLYTDGYQQSKSYYFLPRKMIELGLNYYDYSTGLSSSFQVDIDPDLMMEVGDVFTINIDTDALLEGSGTAGFNWSETNWNDAGEVTIP